MSDFETHDDEVQSQFVALRHPRWHEKLFFWKKPSRSQSEQEWMSYYKDLYIAHGPNVSLFSHLLKRNGFFHISNPFREGNPLYYSFCVDGVSLADVDFVLSFWQQKHLYGRVHSPSEEPMEVKELFQAIEKNWARLYLHRPHDLPNVSLSMSAHSNDVHHTTEQQEWFDEAVHCLSALFLSPSSNWNWMSSHLHKDNLGILCKIVYDNAPLDIQGRLIKNWTDENWLTSSQSQWLANRSATI